MPKLVFRVVSRSADGSLCHQDYAQPEELVETHPQVGVDDCSTHLRLRGMPVFSTLIGPLPEGKHVVRYETPEVFEELTKEWSVSRPLRARRKPEVS